jgi:hypothetical protein
LIPFVGCTILSIILAIKEPKEYPDLLYPYQAEGPLASLSTAWFYIGLIMSAVFLGILIIDDLLNWVGNISKNGRVKKG